jgi:hypothetical protein
MIVFVSPRSNESRSRVLEYGHGSCADGPVDLVPETARDSAVR